MFMPPLLVGVDRRTLVEHAVLHDRKQARPILENAYILERIAVDEQEVRKEARAHLSQLPSHAHQLSAPFRSTHDRFHRRKSHALDENREIPRIRAVRIPLEPVVAT